MNSPVTTETTGWGRVAGIGAVFAIALFPSIWLAGRIFTDGADAAFHEIIRRPFLAAVGRSLVLGGWLLFWSLVVGWPYGVLCGLFNTRLSRVIQGIFLIPIFMPTFLWAIGLANLRPLFPYRLQGWLDGLSGCVFALSAFTIPFVVLATVRSVAALDGSQMEAARLAGGGRRLLGLAFRYSWPAAFSAAAFAVMMTLADPGPAQIMGYHGASSEILIAFAGRNDLGLAIAKSLGLTAMLLPVIAVIAWLCARQMNPELVGWIPRRQASPSSPWSAIVFGAVFLLIPAITLVIPLAGLLKPLQTAAAGKSMAHAWHALGQTAGVTLWYALTAGAVGTGLGMLVALLARRTPACRQAVLLFGFFFLALAPAIHALGLVLLAAHGPPAGDFIFRSGWIVGLGLGLRLMPIGAILGVIMLAKVPRSLGYAAAVHGLSPFTYGSRVLLPLLRPTVMVSVLVIGLLSLADVSSTMMLAPPGATTYPGRIFSVMDNASQTLVASLCLIYLIVGSLPILLLLGLGSRRT